MFKIWATKTSQGQVKSRVYSPSELLLYKKVKHKACLLCTTSCTRIDPVLKCRFLTKDKKVKKNISKHKQNISGNLSLSTEVKNWQKMRLVKSKNMPTVE